MSVKFIISAIFNFPCVNVPVLSNTIVSTFSAFSNISLFLTNIPFFAHTPSLTTIASGVASPKLQGQATTNIVTNVIIASLTENPKIRYIINVIIAIIISTGTNIPTYLICNFCNRCFCICCFYN